MQRPSRYGIIQSHFGQTPIRFLKDRVVLRSLIAIFQRAKDSPMSLSRFHVDRLFVKSLSESSVNAEMVSSKVDLNVRDALFTIFVICEIVSVPKICGSFPRAEIIGDWVWARFAFIF